MNILQINTSDIGGGAEKIAWDLLQAYQARGLGSWLAVGTKRSDHPAVLSIPLVSNTYPVTAWARAWLASADRISSLVGKVRGTWKVRNLLRVIARPRILSEIRRGYEDFDFPGSQHVLDLLAERPDFVHCHNLHGGYFDLRILPWLSQRVPTILTLHDAWLLSGYCAHSFDCEHWKTCCSECPELSTSSHAKREAAIYNWQQKKSIYAESHLNVATPSRWLMHKVEQSILAPAAVESRVIPNGVDLSVFRPGDKREARAKLGIPQDARLLLFVGYNPRNNPFKDFSTLEAAVKQTAECLSTERIILICLGGEHQPEHIGLADVQFIGFQNQSATVAHYYQAADLYLHAAKTDNFPTTVLEALACGTPVVATAVGGIPEQVKNGETGFLAAPGDPATMAKYILLLLTNDVMRWQFGLNAARDACERFDLNHQVDAYIEWFNQIAKRDQKH